MKTLVLVICSIVLLIAITVTVLLYKKSQMITSSPVTPTEEQASPADAQKAIAKTILTASMDTVDLSPAEQSAINDSIDNQLTDDTRLYTIATDAGTTISESTWFFAWQREIYKHTDEAGLTAFITSLGLDEETYKENLRRNLVITTFLESQAAGQVTDAAVKAYYDNLPPSEQDEYEIMAPEIRETLLTQAAIEVRTKLLAGTTL